MVFLLLVSVHFLDNCYRVIHRVIQSSSLVPVLFREVFSHPYISLFHLLVNGFSVTCFRTFFKITVTELSIRCTQVTIWNHDKGKLILMLQVRQLISLVTSHPYLPFCRHIIPILNFISIENIFGCYFFC